MMRTTLILAGTALGMFSLVGSRWSQAEDGKARSTVATASTAAKGVTQPNGSAKMSCQQHLDAAIAALRDEDFDAALDSVNKGLEQCPNDSGLHEFRGLVLFAKGSYQEAASSVHVSIAIRPAWNWSTVGRLYPNVPLYTTHLRALEAFTKKHPDDSAARFLQAYHYIVIGYPESAVRELEMVVRLDGSDRVAAEVLKGLPKPMAGPPKSNGGSGAGYQKSN